MKTFFLVLGLVLRLGAQGLSSIKIPHLPPYYLKKYGEGIAERDPIVLMQLDMDTSHDCYKFDPQSQAIIRKQVEYLALTGNGRAMYLLGKVTHFDRLNPWYKKSADAGDAYGLLQYLWEAEAYHTTLLRGEDPEVYRRKAFDAFKKLADKGDRGAMYQLVFNDFHGLQSKDDVEAWRKKLFDVHDYWGTETKWYYASNFLDPYVIKERPLVLKLMTEAAKDGNFHAMQYLADYYYDGGGPRGPGDPQRVDINKAWYWARRVWEAVGCGGPMPTPEDRRGNRWRKPGEPKGKQAKPRREE